jgi:translation initiation factor IF-2
MANMRVHELAKELNISSKAITDMLSNADKKYTAMSGLGESEINSVKSKFTKAAGNTANKSGPKKAEEKQVKSEENKNIKAQDKTGNKSEQNTQDTKAANTSKDVDKKHISCFLLTLCSHNNFTSIRNIIKTENLYRHRWSSFLNSSSSIINHSSYLTITRTCSNCITNS